MVSEKQRENALRYYYKNREKRIKYQREYDKLHKEEKNAYERDKRRGTEYNRKKKLQHYSREKHFPVLMEKYNGCMLCKSKKRLQIHHKKYTKEIKDCMLVCEECHKKIHRKI